MGEAELKAIAERAFDLANQDFLKDRIARVNEVVEQYGINNFYVSYSGGKDSNVVSKLIDIALPDNHIPRVFIYTGIELNSVVEFVKELQAKDNRIHIVTPKKNIQNVLQEHGYPFKSKIHAKKVDIYQRNGMTKGIKHYLEGDGNPKHFKFICPSKLRYQFTDLNKLKISHWCCTFMKEEPLQLWQRSLGYTIGITGLRQAEGSSRVNVQCLSQRATEEIPRFFNPLSRADDNFMEWMINKYDIALPKVYYPPYNFQRTGCKGCPFNLNLQNELDMLEKYFPAERKQCEIIWKPVYEEYRRLGYRLCRQ